MTRAIHFGLILDDSDGTPAMDFDKTTRPKGQYPLWDDVRRVYHTVHLDGDSFLTWGETGPDSTAHIVVYLSEGVLEGGCDHESTYVIRIGELIKGEMLTDSTVSDLAQRARFSDYAVVTDAADWSEEQQAYITIPAVM